MTPEFALVAIACGVGCATGAYLAARRNSLAIDYAFRIVDVVRAYEPDEGTMDGSQLTFEDAQQAIEARNKVLDDVASNNTGWLRLALEAMQKLPEGTVSTGEGFRLLLTERGLSEPKSPGAWGALTGTLTRRGMLVPTGDWQPMKTKTSHGRLTRVYKLQRPEIAA